MRRPMPLDVLLLAMQRYWRAADVEKAVGLAKIAAPYVHVKASVRNGTPDDVAAFKDEKLDEFCKSSGGGESTAT